MSRQGPNPQTVPASAQIKRAELVLRRDETGTAARSPRRTTLEALLDGAGELLIEHAGREYRLRITQNGKLILTA